jgi:MFS family permease
MCLYGFASYSDKHRIRLMPILLGLAIMVTGLTAVVVLPTSWPIPRYICLTVLVSGCYIASPLTVAWISGNTPSPGKRALLLGINGWGNLAGVISAMLFNPKYAASGYIVPFWWTLACIALAAMAYILLLKGIVVENEKRRKVLDGWDEEDLEREKTEGKGAPVQQYVWVQRLAEVLGRSRGLAWLGEWLYEATKGGREGDEKMTFVYGL